MGDNKNRNRILDKLVLPKESRHGKIKNENEFDATRPVVIFWLTIAYIGIVFFLIIGIPLPGLDREPIPAESLPTAITIAVVLYPLIIGGLYLRDKLKKQTDPPARHPQKGLSMFCPICKCEYRQGFTTCTDCDVALVAESPDGDALETEYRKGAGDSPSTLVPIFETHDQGDIALIKLALDAEEIIYHFSAESFHMMGVRPLPARLLVAADRKEEVLAILKGLEFID